MCEYMPSWMCQRNKACDGKMSLEQIQCIRGLNKDWFDYECAANPAATACANLREAMVRIGLPVSPQPETSYRRVLATESSRCRQARRDVERAQDHQEPAQAGIAVRSGRHRGE